MSGAVDPLLDRAMEAGFREWYRERRRREHAREGNFQYNGPRDPPPTDVHYPSALLKCHRKRRYLEANAPAEEPAPKGIFWAGRSIETELVQPFLEERVAGPAEYVTRGIGFEVRVKSRTGPGTDTPAESSDAVKTDEPKSQVTGAKELARSPGTGEE